MLRGNIVSVHPATSSAVSNTAQASFDAGAALAALAKLAQRIRAFEEQKASKRAETYQQIAKDLTAADGANTDAAVTKAAERCKELNAQIALLDEQSHCFAEAYAASIEQLKYAASTYPEQTYYQVRKAVVYLEEQIQSEQHQAAELQQILTMASERRLSTIVAGVQAKLHECEHRLETIEVTVSKLAENVQLATAGASAQSGTHTTVSQESVQFAGVEIEQVAQEPVFSQAGAPSAQREQRSGRRR